jgi:aspartate/methionine/tyrosine aminotransferase
MSDRHHQVINLSVGDPSGLPPAFLRDVLRDASAHPAANHYTSPLGLTVVREAAAGYYQREHGVMIDPVNVAITHGARPAIFFSLQAAERPQMPAGYFVPAYTAFRAQIIFAGLHPAPIDLPDDQLTHHNLVPLLSPMQGGVFIFNNPQNPTGRVFELAEVVAFCDVARMYGIRIISDFVYGDLYERTPPVSTLKVDPAALEIISLSKPFRACGWRVGAIVGNPSWINKTLERYASMNGVPFAKQQTAAAAWNTMAEVEAFRLDLAQRRAVLANGLRAVGFTLDTQNQNQSGMFLWAGIPQSCGSGAEVKTQLEVFGVLVADGADFGGAIDRYLRIALNEPVAILHNAVHQITKAMEAYDEHQANSFPARRSDERAA